MDNGKCLQDGHETGCTTEEKPEEYFDCNDIAEAPEAEVTLWTMSPFDFSRGPDFSMGLDFSAGPDIVATLLNRESDTNIPEIQDCGCDVSIRLVKSFSKNQVWHKVPSNELEFSDLHKHMSVM